MKKVIYIFIVLTLCFSVFYINNSHKIEKQETENEFQFGEAEEGGEARDEWETERLVDPATGRIPDGIRAAELAFARNLPLANSNNIGRANPWQSRGPWNIGGRTRAMAIDVNNENRIIAGCVSGGVFVTEDAGQTWTPTKGLGNNLGIVSITQDKRVGKTDTWYALTGEGTGTSASGGSSFFLGDGMYKSIDNGLNWSPLASTSGGNAGQFTQIYQVGWRTVTDPSNLVDDVVLMATYGGIYRSWNGGTTFAQVKGNGAAKSSYYTDVAVTTTGVFYAVFSSDGTDKGIYRSTNGGLDWTNITPTNFPPVYDRIVIGINPNNENEVYFLGSTKGYGHKSFFITSEDWASLWRYNYEKGTGTTTTGAWIDLSDNLPKGAQFDTYTCQGGYDLLVKVQPQTNAVFIGGSNLYRSTDGFTSQTNTTKIGGYKIGTSLPYFEIYPNHHPDQHDVLFSPSDNKKMYSASDGGINVTDDCNAPFVNWRSLNNGYVTTQLYTVNIEHSLAGDPTIVGGFQDNGNFFVNDKNPKKSWVQTVNGDGSFAAITNGKKNYYLSIQNGKMAKCELDANGKVLKYNRIDPIGGKGYKFINPFVLDPNDENTMYLAGGKRLWRNNQLDKIDLVGKWDSIATGWFSFQDTIKGTGTITAIAAAKSTNRVYFGSTNGKIYRVDNPASDTSRYKEITVTGVTAARYVTCITVDPDNADNVTVAYSNYVVYSVFQTKDGGKNWLKVAGNLEANLTGNGVSSPSIRWISILKFPSGAKKYFAATSIGLFSADSLVAHTSTNPGTKWVNEGNNEIGNVVCNHIDVRSVDGLVAVATHGAGAFTANFDDLGIVKTKEVSANSGFELYPNPANDVVYWKSENPILNTAQITIFDLKGNIVKQQNVNSNQLNISDLQKGVYLFQLKNGKQQVVKKLMIQ